MGTSGQGYGCLVLGFREDMHHCEDVAKDIEIGGIQSGFS